MDEILGVADVDAQALGPRQLQTEVGPGLKGRGAVQQHESAADLLREEDEIAVVGVLAGDRTKALHRLEVAGGEYAAAAVVAGPGDAVAGRALGLRSLEEIV